MVSSHFVSKARCRPSFPLAEVSLFEQIHFPHSNGVVGWSSSNFQSEVPDALLVGGVLPELDWVCGCFGTYGRGKNVANGSTVVVL